MAGFQAELRELRDGFADDERVPVVVTAARTACEQAVLLELGQLVLLEPGRIEQLGARQPHFARIGHERLGFGQALGSNQRSRDAGTAPGKGGWLEAAV